MYSKEDFFIKENSVPFIPNEYYEHFDLFVKFLDAFSRSTYKSMYVIDYYKKKFLYVSDNPLFLCGLSPKMVQEMGYDFFIKFVPENDISRLIEINQAGFIFADGIPVGRE